MTYSEKLAFIGDLTRAQFAGVTNITGIAPVEECLAVNSAGGAVDFLAPVAGHIYYIEEIILAETTILAANVAIQTYDIAAVASTIFNVNQNPVTLYGRNFWCSRLAQLGATTGFYSIMFHGFDITYT